MKYLLLVLLAFSIGAFSQEFTQEELDQCKTSPDCSNARVTLTRPYFRVGGIPLAFDEIAGYEILYRQVDAEVFNRYVVGPDDLVFLMPGFSPGEQYDFRYAAFDTDGLFSDYSDPAVVIMEFSAAAPGKPDSPQVETDVYSNQLIRTLSEVLALCQQDDVCRSKITIDL